MKKLVLRFVILGAAICLTIGASLTLQGCSASNDSDDDSDDDATENGSTSSTKCSEDGSETLVPGTYAFALSSSVSSKRKTQVKILKSDCIYCFETVTEGDSTALTSDGSWTSKLGTKDSSGQAIDITAGGVVYTLSGDGLTLSQSSSVWSKASSSRYTCD